MSNSIKKEYYRLLGLLEQAQQQADGSDMSPLISVETGKPLLAETRKLSEELRERIAKIKRAISDFE